MKHDHKPRPAKAAPKSGGGTLLGVFIGLVLGVMIAFGLVWYLNKTPLPFQEKVGHNGGGPLPTEANPGQAPQGLPPKPGDKAPDKPRFEFYKILPGGQEAAPSAGAEEKPAAPAEVLYLQVGAFQKPADADNLKAKLALMGVEANVQEVAVPEKGTMHRVRVGPFKSPDDMNRVRNQLAQNDVQSTLVKTAAPAADAKAEPKTADKAKAESKSVKP